MLEPRSWLNFCGQETHFDLDSQKDAIGDHHESGEHVESIVFHNPAGVSCVFFLEIQFGFNSVLKQSTLQKKHNHIKTYLTLWCSNGIIFARVKVEKIETHILSWNNYIYYHRWCLSHPFEMSTWESSPNRSEQKTHQHLAMFAILVANLSNPHKFSTRPCTKWFIAVSNTLAQFERYGCKFDVNGCEWLYKQIP